MFSTSRAIKRVNVLQQPYFNFPRVVHNISTTYQYNMPNNTQSYHDDPPQRHIECIDKGSFWPRWGSPLGNFNLIPPSLLPASSTQNSTSPINYVVVRNTSNLPMNSIMPLIEQYTNRLAQQSNQSPSQTVVVILSGNIDNIDTNTVLNRLFMSHQPQTIRASRAFVENLDQITITSDTLAKEHQCTVCMEDFKLEDKAAQLPCKHCFHQSCIKTWLNTHHTCPVCRHELPTESRSHASIEQLQPTDVQSDPAPSTPVNSPPTENTTPSLPIISSPEDDPLPVPDCSPVSNVVPSPIVPDSSSASDVSSPYESSPSSPSSTPVPPVSTPSSPSQPKASGIKRGFLVSPSKEQANKKKKVDESEKKDEDKENRDSNKDNGFGFRKGFLLPK